MEIENVSWIRLSARRTLQEQGDLTPCPGVLGQIIVYHKGILSLVPEIFSNAASCKRSKIPEGCCVRSYGSHHDRILHSSPVLQVSDKLCHLARLLSNGNINTHGPLFF